jgi:hypothetical protein
MPGVPLRDAQEAASHADPRTMMRYDRARGSLDRRDLNANANRRSARPASVELLRTDRYRVAYPIVVPPRSLIVKPSSACLSAMSMSS